MATTTLEHVNITVSNPAKTARTLCSLFGWTIRWSGAAKDNGVTYHVGSKDSYLAIYAGKTSRRSAETTYETIGGLNHVGVVVDDLQEAERRVVAAGFEPRSHADYEPGKRFYFDDEDGIEYEVVSYD